MTLFKNAFSVSKYYKTIVITPGTRRGKKKMQANYRSKILKWVKEKNED